MSGRGMMDNDTCSLVALLLFISAGTGILSPLPEENPHWWNANMV